MLWDIYEQHLSEAAFLWTQWEQTLSAPDYVLSEVEQQEERLHAHVDGLVLGAEPVAKRFLFPALEGDDPELIRTAAFTLLQEGSSTGAEVVLKRVRSADDAGLAALQRALEVLEPDLLPPWLTSLTQDENPALQALGLEVLGFHQRAPAAACQTLVIHASPRIAAAALRAAGRSRIELNPTALERALAASSLEVRDAAIEAGTLLGHRAALAVCRAAVQSRALAGPLPLLLLAMRGDERDLQRIQELLSEEKLRPHALWALGFSGRLSCADRCLEFMQHKPVAALAGEAFSAITGLRIEGTYAAEGEAPAAEEPVPLEQENLEADLLPKPEDALPLPQADAIASWWEQKRPHLEPQRRYLEGRIFDFQVLKGALESSPMRRRHVLAWEFAMSHRNAPLVPTRAFVKRQREALRTAAG